MSPDFLDFSAIFEDIKAMSSFTFADNKLGGRLMVAADAIAAGHLRTAAGIFNELGDELNIEAESTDGLMAEEPEWPLPAKPEVPSMSVKGQPSDLQSCARNVHMYGAVDPVSGWRKCDVCGMVNVAPPSDA